MNARQFGITFSLLAGEVMGKERKASSTPAKYNNSSKEELESW